jgi:inhibitor of cysteine peptidase
MKKLIATTLVLFAITVCGFAQTSAHKTANAAASANFEQFHSYFEKNNSGLKGDKSYIALTSQKQFDKVFGPAATMGPNSFLPTDAFKSKVVVATIKRGALRKYDNVKATEEGGTLFIWYDAKDDEPSSATFRSPLILAVDKGKYKQVVFMENGKKAGTARLGRSGKKR